MNTNTMNTMNNQTEFALFLFFKQVGMYQTKEQAEQAITQKGIYNICEVTKDENNKYKVINREAIRKD